MSDFGRWGIIFLSLSVLAYVLHKKAAYIIAAVFGAVSFVLGLIALIRCFVG